jgi:hypothetical protein
MFIVTRPGGLLWHMELLTEFVLTRVSAAINMELLTEFLEALIRMSKLKTPTALVEFKSPPRSCL